MSEFKQGVGCCKFSRFCSTMTHFWVIARSAICENWVGFGSRKKDMYLRIANREMGNMIHFFPPSGSCELRNAKMGHLDIPAIFLGVPMHLYKRVCPSVRRSVNQSVHPWVRNAFSYQRVSKHLMPCCFSEFPLTSSLANWAYRLWKFCWITLNYFVSAARLSCFADMMSLYAYQGQFYQICYTCASDRAYFAETIVKRRSMYNTVPRTHLDKHAISAVKQASSPEAIW